MTAETTQKKILLIGITFLKTLHTKITLLLKTTLKTHNLQNHILNSLVHAQVAVKLLM